MPAKEVQRARASAAPVPSGQSLNFINIMWNEVSCSARAENCLTIVNPLQTNVVHMKPQHIPFLLELLLLFLITGSLCTGMHKVVQLKVTCCVF